MSKYYIVIDEKNIEVSKDTAIKMLNSIPREKLRAYAKKAGINQNRYKDKFIKSIINNHRNIRFKLQG